MRSEVSLAVVAFSTTIHAAMIAMLIVAPDDLWKSDAETNFVTTALRYLLPPMPEVASPGGERVHYVSALGGGMSAGVDAVRKHEVRAIERDTSGAGDRDEADRPVQPIEQAAAEEHAFTYTEVDSVAMRDERSAGPDYPPELRKKGIEGYASLRFVVDSTGLIDLASVEVLEATNPEFAQAVRDVMPRMRFRPAKQGATAVRQISEQRFRFRLESPVVPPEPTRKKP
ncbi:MAG: energy transducer TonB [Gemmatimonadota bacterium]